jgi:glucose/mannose transport system substrate-binding protein
MTEARRRAPRAAASSRRRRWAATVLGVALASLGCASGDAASAADGPDAPPRRELVELFSWWTAPGEAGALQALIDTHHVTYPGARLFNAAASGTEARELLAERLSRHDPPDLFQQNAHDFRAFLADNPGALEPLDAMFDADGLGRVVLPEVVRDLTIDGHIYAMPVNLHRENALFYNRALFAAHGLEPPTTLRGLLDLCATLRALGITPIATSHQDWILRIMFHAIVMGHMGSARYHAYFTGQSPEAAPMLREAIDVFATVLERYTNADAGEEGFGWINAAQAVYNGDAAMLLHGDWTTGYFEKLGWTPNVDFGVVGATGAADLFLYGVDAFAFPRHAPNPRGAREFLGTIASPAGQVAFNRLKGSSPIRTDIDLAQLSPVGRATWNDLEHAAFRMLVRNRPAWDGAFARFAKTRDRDALFRVFVETPPVR